MGIRVYYRIEREYVPPAWNPSSGVVSNPRSNLETYKDFPGATYAIIMDDGFLELHDDNGECYAAFTKGHWLRWEAI